MDKLVNITLIRQEMTTNDIGEQNIVETPRKVRGHLDYVSSTEWFSAHQNGVNSKFRVVVYDFEYQNETIAEVNGKRYAIYRSYFVNGNKIELYLREEGGV